MLDPIAFMQAANAKSKARRARGTELLAASAASPAFGYGSSESGLAVPPMSGNFQPPNANGKWVNPLAGKLAVSSPYGPRVHPIKGTSGMHTGTDFKAGAGTPVFAVADGKVKHAAGNSGAYGNQVIIGVGGGLQTMYGHLSRYTVQPGQRVRKGQVIGYVGSTGLSTGPHLHFETTYKGQTVNPSRYL